MNLNKIIVCTGAFLFLSGVYFKALQKQGAGTLLGFGLIFIIYGYSKFFYLKVGRKPSDYLLLFITIFSSSIIFSLIQQRNFIEILSAATIVSFASISIEYFYNKLKEYK